MNTLLRKIFFILTLLYSVSGLCSKTSEADEVRHIIDKVNTYWQSHNSPETRAFWDNAAYHTGNMEAYFLTGNDSYKAYSEAWADHNQ